MTGFLKALVALDLGLNFSIRKNEPILGGIVGQSVFGGGRAVVAFFMVFMTFEYHAGVAG